MVEPEVLGRVAYPANAPVTPIPEARIPSSHAAVSVFRPCGEHVKGGRDENLQIFESIRNDRSSSLDVGLLQRGSNRARITGN